MLLVAVEIGHVDRQRQIAANARAASVSAKVIAKRRSPTVIHMRDSSDRTDAAAATVGEPAVPGWPASQPPSMSRPNSSPNARSEASLGGARGHGVGCR